MSRLREITGTLAVSNKLYNGAPMLDAHGSHCSTFSHHGGVGVDIELRLQAVRKAKGLSQRELAKRVGVTNSTISLIEQNRSAPRSVR